MTETLDIAWIGLGEMGSRMAPRLAARGHRVTAFDPNPRTREAAALSGIRPAASLEEALLGKDVAFSMIPDDGALLQVVGACGALAKAATYVDMSTVSPRASAEAARRLTEAGLSYLRAPVSGSTGLAEAGTLTVLVSGPIDVFERRRGLLDVLGSAVRHLGAAEEARTAKLMVNTVVAGLNQALAEALDLGRRGGLDWTAMVDLLDQSAVASPYISSKVGKLKQRQWLPAAAPVSLIAKDVRLALELGRELGAYMPVTAGAGAVLNAAEGRGRGALDMCSVAAFFEEP